MLILAIRTDKPEAEIYLYRDTTQVDSLIWHADRRLSDTLHLQIKKIIELNEFALNDIQALAVYEGPGSFTGLRIGFSVANALANSLNAPIVSSTSDHWLDQATKRLLKGENEETARPEYGAPPNITQPKK